MRHPHKWEEMLPEEFYAEFRRAPIAYLACGAVEEHGLHNALATDPWTAYEVCLRAAAIAGGVVHPIVPLAPAWIPGLSRQELRARQRELYPPSLWVSREACELVYTELMESMADMGFRMCLAVGGHYPADLLLGEMEKARSGQINGMRFWGGGVFRLLRELWAEEMKQDPGLFGHGMMWETSCVMAQNRDWVDLERVDRIKSCGLVSQLTPQSDANLARIREASVGFGQRFLDTAARRLAALATEGLGQACLTSTAAPSPP